MKWFLAAFVALLAAGCSFSPMYGQLQANGSSVIGPVVVAQIDGSAGHVLKAELDRILAIEHGAGPPLQLEVTLAETIVGAGYRVDESTTRAHLTLTANYQLHFPDGAVARGSISTLVVYDIPQSAFGEIAAQSNARRRAAEVMAQRMRAELALRVSRLRRT